MWIAGCNILYANVHLCNALSHLNTNVTAENIVLRVGACGLVDRALESRSKGLGFHFHHWSCVEVLGKLLIP